MLQQLKQAVKKIPKAMFFKRGNNETVQLPLCRFLSLACNQQIQIGKLKIKTLTDIEVG
jgi:hypothetical protein